MTTPTDHWRAGPRCFHCGDNRPQTKLTLREWGQTTCDPCEKRGLSMARAAARRRAGTLGPRVPTVREFEELSGRFLREGTPGRCKHAKSPEGAAVEHAPLTIGGVCYLCVAERGAKLPTTTPKRRRRKATTRPAAPKPPAAPAPEPAPRGWLSRMFG